MSQDGYVVVDDTHHPEFDDSPWPWVVNKSYPQPSQAACAAVPAAQVGRGGGREGGKGGGTEEGKEGEREKGREGGREQLLVFDAALSCRGETAGTLELPHLIASTR